MKSMLRALFWGMAATVLLLFAWLMVPSSLILRPVSMTYNPETGKATFQRIVNWYAPVTARWAHTIYSLDGREQCNDDGIRRYSPRVAQEVIGVSGRLEECLDKGSAHVVAVLTWSVLVYGIIPMRPTTLIIPADARLPQ
jgi:hypothetical protein